MNHHTFKSHFELSDDFSGPNGFPYFDKAESNYWITEYVDEKGCKRRIVLTKLKISYCVKEEELTGKMWWQRYKWNVKQNVWAPY
jgi:hypothetical protein